MSQSNWIKSTRTALVILGCMLALVVKSLADRGATQWLYLNTAYYLQLAAVLCWIGIHIHAHRHDKPARIMGWLKDNLPGLLVATAVTLIAGLAVEPALRVLSDEANLIGTSKNLFASKSPTFTVSGKYYYESYWDIDVAVDQRPLLFPFLLSLVHSVLGYDYENAFVLNLAILPGFVLLTYRLSKSLGGEATGLVTSLLASAHPIFLLSVRSGGFDFLNVTLAVLIVKSMLELCRAPSADKTALVWMNLVVFSGARYESVLFLPLTAGLLFALRILRWDLLRPYAFLYAVTPAFLFPRLWVSLLSGSLPKQDPGVDTIGLRNFVNNLYEYFQPLLEPSGSFPAHSALLVLLGLGGIAKATSWLVQHVRSKRGATPELEFAILSSTWIVFSGLVLLGYFWGRAQYPSSARLVIPIDVAFVFLGSWALADALKRWPQYVPVLVATGILLTQVPGPGEQRMMNQLTQSRESAATWKYFEDLDEKRIMIVTDRPNHFTIMNYGAMNFEAARSDAHLLTALERRLFQELYVIQRLEISSGNPLTGYAIWSEESLVPVLEFQNDANVLVRVSRLID